VTLVLSVLSMNFFIFVFYIRLNKELPISKFYVKYENILFYYICELYVRYITLYYYLSCLRSLQMHYESEITLEYSTHTHECIKSTDGDIDSFSIF